MFRLCEDNYNDVWFSWGAPRSVVPNYASAMTTPAATPSAAPLPGPVDRFNFKVGAEDFDVSVIGHRMDLTISGKTVAPLVTVDRAPAGAPVLNPSDTVLGISIMSDRTSFAGWMEECLPR